jgi:hypothetical protein
MRAAVLRGGSAEARVIDDPGPGPGQRWVRTQLGWRIAERINAPLDGTPGHREMLVPPAVSRLPGEE